MVGRGVDICNGEGETRQLGVEDDGEGETIVANGHKRVETGVPGSDDPAGAPHSVDGFEAREVTREERGSDKAINRTQLGFL
jgi:hypothetical protein